MLYLARGLAALLFNQHNITSISCEESGLLFDLTIISPLLISISSSRVIDTDIGANASSKKLSKVSIDLILEVNPEGRTVTSSPFRNIPLAILPAYPL